MWSDIARAAEITPIGSAWLPILFDAAVKGAVVVGLAGAATLLMRRCSAAARHLVWCLAVASLPLLPILSAVSPDWHVLPRWMAMSTDMAGEVSLAAAAEPTAPGEPTATQEAVLPGDRANMAEVPIEPAARQPTPPNVVERPEADRPAATAPPRPPDLAPNQAGPSRAVPWQTWGLLVWLVGTLLTLVPVGLGMLSLWRLRRRAEPITGGPWISQLHQLAAQLGVSRRMVLLRSNRRSMPMHWGILRPKLLLPAVADRWPDDRRRVVLLHELAHVKRWDCLAQLVTQLACALYWFNPLVWVALRQMHLEREAACDDLILRAGYRPPDYAEHLLQIASGLQADLFATYSAIAMARPSRLESRLRAILDAGRNRRTLTRAAVLVIVTLLAGAVVPVAMMRAANGEKGTDEDQTAKDATAPAETEADGRTYDHFLYVRHNQKGGVAKTDTLVLARVTSGGFEQRDLYTKNNFNIGWTPLCVIDGTVYGVKIDDLIAIDVATGRAERICSHVRSHAYNAGRLYTIVPTGGDKPVLRVFDFPKRVYRDVGPVDVDWSRPPIAVSPDHRRLALFEGLGNVKTASSFRLHVVDLKTGRVETPGPTVHSMPFMTGGGDVCDGPPFVWLDPKTILLVHDVPKNVPKDPARFISFSGGEVGVATMDVTGGKLTDLLKLPRWQRRLREPYLRPLGKDGVPRIVMGELGQYRIDIRAKRLLEDDRIGGDYRWSRGRQPERLSHGKTPLIEAERIPEVAVSPDGRRLVWLTKRGSTDAELRYHDVDAKAVRVVAQGWFPTIWEPHRRPEETIFLWGSREDLAPGEKSRPPAGWKPFSTGPWPKPPGRREVDERPDVIDFLTMTLSTDKRAYEHHQPVKLTVTLANKSETDVTFKRPEGYTNFFRLRMRYPRGSRVVDEFSRPEEVFKTDPVVVKAGTSFQCTRTLEPWDLGEHKVEGGFRLNTRQWRGRLKTETIRFVVQKSPDEDRLLKAKFDRFLAQCRREFESDPMRCDYARFFDLGPAAVPHLVAALEASDDAKFRRRMGSALARMANADAIPYFEKLLKGEMKTDSEMVLEGLLTMYQRSRSPNEALRLLLEALKHSNAGFRRGAAERLSQIYDRRVAAGFERAVADADKRTAVTAARYLAASEGLDLADWLGRAADQPTLARYLAAPSIILQLEQRWDLKKGDLPEVAWEDLAKDAAKLAQYKKVLRAWQQWAQENPRSSAHFFDTDRQQWPKETLPSRAAPTEAKSGEATTRPATPPAQDAAASGWGEASGPLRCKIVPSGTQIVAGQPLTFRLVVQNVGKESVLLNNRIGTRVAFYVNDRFVSQEVSLYDGFAFKPPADDPRYIPVPPGGSVQAALPVGVLATKRFTDVADRRMIDSTANPGTYRVHAVYSQRGTGGYPARWWRGTVHSPAVQIKVLPAHPTKSFPPTPAADPSLDADRKPWPKEDRPGGARPSGDAGKAAPDAGTQRRKGSSVTGRVFDVPGGKAAGGVTVTLWHSGDGKLRKARTDKLGRYSFQDVPASGHEYVLRVGTLPTGVWSEGASVTVGKEDVRAGDLYVSRPQSISGVVRDVATGKPVAGVGVNFSTTDAKGNRDEVTTDVQGRFRLYVVPREVELHCEGTDRYYAEARGKTVTVKVGQHLGNVDLMVQSAPAIAGRILLPRGKPAGNLDIDCMVHWSWSTVQDQKRIAEAKERKAKQQPSPDEGKSRPFERREGPKGFSIGPGAVHMFRVKTDREGRFPCYLREPFSFDRDAAVDIIIHARLADHSLAGMKVVETTTIDPPPDPVELKLVPTGAAVFTVVNPDGRPIADARPSTFTVMGYRHTDTPTEVRPRFKPLGSGRYHATGLVPDWGYRISATAKGYRCRRNLPAVVEPSETLDAGTLRLDWWGKKAVPGLVKNLSSKDRRARQGACRELTELGPDAAEAVPTLIRLLNDDPSNVVRFSAATALGAIGPAAKMAVPALTRAFLHDKDGVPREAAKALGRLGLVGAEDLAQVIEEVRFSYAQPERVTGLLQVLTGRRFANLDEVLVWWWSFPLSQPAARPADRDAATLETLWVKLAEPVGPDAYRAIALMAAGGDDAVSFIARSVKPVAAGATRIKSLIAELDHDEYAARRRALLELSRLGRVAEPHLRTALGSGPSFEARKSIQQLLKASAKPYPALPEARRTARAIRVLELIGTDRSEAVLRDLAKGIPKAVATEHAQAALRRMGRGRQGAPKPVAVSTQATLGPVIEQTLNHPRGAGPQGPLPCLIDFDTGRVIGRPVDGSPMFDSERRYTDAFKKFIAKNGMDAIIRVAKLDPAPAGLVGFGMTVVPVKNDQWGIDPRQLAERLANVKPRQQQAIRRAKPDGEKRPPTTYLFRTREGRTGVLQITSATWSKVHTSWKLLQTPEEMAAWCDPVDGLRIRLRPTQSQWKLGTTPTLALDLWNDNDQNKMFHYGGMQEAECRIEVDGQWYHWGDPWGMNSPDRFLKAGHAVDGAVKISLTRSWARTGERNVFPADDALRLNLTPGIHTVRVAFTPRGARSSPRVVSLPAVIKMIAKSDDKVATTVRAQATFGRVIERAGSWSQAVAGVKIRLRPDRVT